MSSKPERTIPPAEGLFGGEFQPKLAVVMSGLVNDNYAKRYTFHSFEARNVTTCTVVANSIPAEDTETPRGIIVLGHFDNYDDITASLECAVYTVTGRYPTGLVFTPQKGNIEFFNDPRRIEDINTIFSLGSKQPQEPEEEYFQLLANKLKTY